MGACAPKTKGPGKGPYGTTCPVSPGEEDGEGDGDEDGDEDRDEAGKTGEEEVSNDQSGRHRHRHRHRRRLDAHGGLDHYWVDPCR